MPRLTLTPETPVPQELQARFDKVTAPGSGLADTYRALFANPRVASGLADLDELVGQCDMELWITYTVALAVAHERNSVSIWNAFEPLAREAGVRDAVIDGIASGTAPRGLLPKEGIWLHFALEVIRCQVRDSTWQAVTHLVGDAGAVSLAFTACYYEMMGRLNSSFGLDTS